ncbi:ABC transporter permease [Diaminobutyricimonas sp. LJ205]|uniref:ABC transporter permease n=1 Tax=Diaminobutyricimonas sp. LJ205 TaxID=2683590 RepID=UPI0012F4C1E1|nr:ABC transporter permease [Diaminobutyricimonas sp. LJ205]
MNWLLSNLDLVWALTLSHIRLSAIPIVLGFVIAVPLGWVAWRYQWTRATLLTVVGLLYTIPSLALFVLIPPILGISFLSELNVIIALTIYAVALMVRSATDALGSVGPDVRQSATAVGYAGWGRFWKIELPLAGPVLLAGLRVVSVSTVSLLTVGVLIGADSLGYLFTNGLQRGIGVEILTGIVVTMLVALLFDVILVLVGRLLMPWLPFVQAQRGRQASA